MDDILSGMETERKAVRQLLLTKYKGAKAAFYMEDETLLDIRLEISSEKSRLGEIYVGRIKSVADGIGAAFVEYDKGTVGFLPLSQIRPELILNRDDPARITPEQELLVQVFKDPMKNKDATLTTDLMFSGKFLILTPRSKGIRFSRKLKKDDKKNILELVKRILIELFGDDRMFLDHYGLIVRTNALYAGFYDMFYELHEIFHNACEVLSKSKSRTAFSLLYQDAPFYRRILRDQYDLSTIKVITDDENIRDSLMPRKSWEDGEAELCPAISHLTQEERERFLAFVKNTAPEDEMEAALSEKGGVSVTLWEDRSYTLADRYGIKSAIDKAMSKRVWLRSGAFIVIEPTEALTVIDVNSGKASSKKMSPENFNLRVNLDAAYEIARQLRLRNLSGIIIVDFINLDQDENRERLIHTLKRELLSDPVGAGVVDITALGLVEITRKKTESPLAEKIKTLEKSETQ